MKILLVHEFYRSSAPSGEDAVFLNERAMLENSDIDVNTLEVHNDDIDDSKLTNRIKLGIETIWSVSGYKKVKHAISSYKPDVVHFHNTFPLLSPSVFKACKDSDVPVVQTLHNFRHICPGALLQRSGKPCEDCISNTLLSSIKNKCYRDSLLATAPLASMIAFSRAVKNYENVTKYITLTKFAASRFKAAGIPHEKISVKPNFIPSPPKLNCEKQDYAVYVGRLSGEKGVHTLIKAWTSLKNIPLQVLGDGPLRAKLEEYSKKHNLPITFRGSLTRDKVLEIINSAKIQLIPSEWYEGFPMVVLEAYASGTPLIASRIGSLDELITDNVTGLKFTPGNPEELKQAVISLWKKDDLLRAMSKNVRAVFNSKYTEEKNLKQLLGIYESAISK